jgi:ATPase subunit of ABC transporter with duplicated ATPase domains
MLLAANNISFGYTRVPLFQNVSFTINRNDRIGLVGDNGAGKTQMLKTLMHAYREPIVNQEKGLPIRFNPQVNIGYFDQFRRRCRKSKALPNMSKYRGNRFRSDKIACERRIPI